MKTNIIPSPQQTRQALSLGLLLVASLVTTFFASGASRVLAAGDGLCPSGMSQLDCDSIYGDWTSWVPGTLCGSSSGGSTVLTGSDGIQKAYNYFVSKGLSSVQAAAADGNLDDESSLNPTIMQGGGNSTNPAAADPGGWGIAQWTPGSKTPGLAKAAGISGDLSQLGTQLDLVWSEMTGTSPTGYSNLVQDLKKINDLSTATSFFQHNFEGGVDGQRQQDAQDILNKYGGGSGNSGSSSSSSGSSGCSTAGSITCNNTSSSATGINVSTTGLSTIRQAVVTDALCELALWKSQPGYPHPAFAAKGYLKYTDGWYEEWCADFTSWIYKTAGQSFSGGIAGGWMLAAVSEIQALGQKGGQFHWHPAGSGYTPKPGDIAIHGGQHVNIFITSNGGTATYIGGDQGDGPYGSSTPLPPGSTPPFPPSGSIVSTETESGYYGGGITGYVSPD